MTARPKDVPEAWKHPVGPYRQAPPEYGGEWWLVNPFSGPEPWLLLDRPPPRAEVLPQGFEDAFGLRPVKSDYPTRRAWKSAVVEWERDKKNFVQSGTPGWATAIQLNEAAGVLAAWGMGRPAYYEHRHWGWMARFVESQIPDFEMNAHTTVIYTHLAAANYQIRLLQEEIRPDVMHPLIRGLG